MSITDFIEKFAFAIEAETSTLQAGTRFKELPTWDSLNTLAIIAMADSDYGVTLSGQDIQDAVTVEDLWRVVSTRLPSGQ